MTNKTINVKEDGFTLLAEGQTPVADVILIHGLQGHPRKTWTYQAPNLPEKEQPASKWKDRHRIGRRIRSSIIGSKKNDPGHTNPDTAVEVYWPLDLLPQDFSNIRIFTYGYDSKVTHWFRGLSMQLDIFSYGESLLNGIEAHRRVNPSRPLIFIVHSLGGLILKDALRRARTAMDDRFRVIYRSTGAIFFLGTPHRGGSYVNIALTVRKIMACAGIDTSDKALRTLTFDSSTAKLLREEFAKMLDDRRPKIYTFQEALGLTGFGPLSGKVVENSSSALDYALEQKDFIHANHVDMCRFSGFDDDGYVKLRAGISHCLESNTYDTFTNQSSGLRQEILASLFQPETQERFDQINQAYESTCGWLFEDESLGFVEWLRNGNGIFWITGKPGSGKSTLMKYAVTDPRTFQNLYANHTQNRWIWAEFFFSERGAPGQKTLDGLLHRILYQLLSQAEDLLEFFTDVYHNSVNIQGRWLLIYLEQTLIKIAAQRKVRLNICLFVDALDEYSPDYGQTHWRLIEILQAFVAKADGRCIKIMLCLSSRPENLFKDVFKKSPSFQVHLKTNFDIHTYVHGRINAYLASRDDLSSDPDAIISLTASCREIVRRAQGVFLWVAFVTTNMIEALTDGESPEDLERLLSAIEGDGDLFLLYQGILLRLKPTHLQEAYVMLQIAYAALKPWPVTEFFEAVGFTCSTRHNLDVMKKQPSEVGLERRLVSRCRGFLELQDSVALGEDLASGLHSGKVVQFLHRTVKEFLAVSKSFERIRRRLETDMIGNGHSFIANYRVKQHLQWYAQQPVKLKITKDERKYEIFYQAKMSELTSGLAVKDTLDELSDFIDSHGLVDIYFTPSGLPNSWERSFLGLAVYAGLVIYVQYLIAGRKLSINSHDGPLLHYAVHAALYKSFGLLDNHVHALFEEMVQLLISQGADLEQERDGMTAFAFAFMEITNDNSVDPSDLKFLSLLLDAGASVNTVAQWAAAENEPKEQDSAKGMLASSPDVKMPRGFTPLQLAVRKANRPLTKLLFVHGAKTSALTPADWKYMGDYDEPMLRLIKKYHDNTDIDIVQA